jgi:hypothetical protein
VDREQHRVQIEALNPEVDALAQPQAATIQQQSDQVIGRMETAQEGFNLGTGLASSSGRLRNWLLRERRRLSIPRLWGWQGTGPRSQRLAER